MRVGVDNTVIWITVAAKDKMQQAGGMDSAVLRFVGVVDHEVRRGTVVEIERTHIPFEARGRVALALEKFCKPNSQLWIFGSHRDYCFTDGDGKDQHKHKLMILVNAFEVDRKIDFDTLFKD